MTDAIDLDEVLDEMHAAVLPFLPSDLMDLSDIDAARTRLDGLLAAMPVPEMPGNVTVSEVQAPGLEGEPEVRIKLYTPDGLPVGAPALYWIHGGGMVLLDADGDDFLCATRAAEHDCLVASVDYRLAPEHRAPAAINDCYAGLVWLSSHSAEVGISAERIMIGGASAGGGLATGTALKAHDLGGPSLTAQLLVYPMLDHRNVTASSHAIHDLRVWNRSANLHAWEAYLGGEEPTPYSSPAIAEDLSGLPSAYINVGTFDMFHDENVTYATALNRAGVACELHVYPGAFHGSNGFVVDHPTSIRWGADQEAFISRAFAASAGN